MNLPQLKGVDITKVDYSTIPLLFKADYAKFGMDASNEIAFIQQMIENEKGGKLRGALETEKGKKSFAIAINRAAACGLSANPYQKHYALVAYGETVKLTSEYRGEIHLMRRDFGVKTVKVDIVVEGEKFEPVYNDKDEVVRYSHKKKPFRNVTEESLIGGYFVVEMNDGRISAETISKEHILSARAAAPAKVIWAAWFEKMSLKTIIHQCFDFVAKYNEVSPEASLRIMDLREAESVQDLPENEYSVIEEEEEMPEENEEAEEISDDIPKTIVEWAEFLKLDFSAYTEETNNVKILTDIIKNLPNLDSFNDFGKVMKSDIVENSLAKVANEKYKELKKK